MRGEGREKRERKREEGEGEKKRVSRTQSGSTSLKQSDFESWGREFIGHLCLLTDLIQRKKRCLLSS